MIPQIIHIVPIALALIHLKSNCVNSLFIVECCNQSTLKCEKGNKITNCSTYHCGYLKTRNIGNPFQPADDESEGSNSTAGVSDWNIYLHRCQSLEPVSLNDSEQEFRYRLLAFNFELSSQFCMVGEEEGYSKFDIRNLTDVDIHQCEYIELNANSDLVRSRVYIVMDTIAASFAFLTILSFVLVYEKQNIHGWTQCTHVCAFFLLLLSWLGSEFIDEKELKGTRLCRGLAIFNHFIYVSTYSWLVVVNFDLMKAFWIKRHKDRLPKCGPIYFNYTLFGWGVPGVVVLISLTVDQALGSFDGLPIDMLPNYGISIQSPCSVDFIDWPYVLLVNSFLFILVILIILNTLRIVVLNPGWFRTQSKNHHQGKLLIWKILLAMGTFWFMDILSLTYIFFNQDMSWYLVAMDFFVLLQAIPIFLIYVCRPDCLTNLGHKFPRLKGCLYSFGRCCCVDMPKSDDQSQELESLQGRLRAHRGSVDTNLRT